MVTFVFVYSTQCTIVYIAAVFRNRKPLRHYLASKVNEKKRLSGHFDFVYSKIFTHASGMQNVSKLRLCYLRKTTAIFCAKYTTI